MIRAEFVKPTPEALMQLCKEIAPGSCTFIVL